MADTSRSSRVFAERRGLRFTYRGPVPTFLTGTNPVHAQVLAAPLPLPELSVRVDGSPSTDGGATTEWPPSSPG